MKNYKLLLILLFGLLISTHVHPQTNPRLVNENYMQTVFFDDFSEPELNRNIWNVTTYKRGLGVLADDPRTLRVFQGNLELKMIYSPNYTSGGYTGDYVGAEISTKYPYIFRYGSYECLAIFAYQKASQPAFWLIGNDGTQCPSGPYGNEIDIAELKCIETPYSIDHVIHRYYPTANCEGYHTGKDKYPYYGMSFDNNFHLFKCVWTPERIVYYVDGIFTHQVYNSGQEWYPNNYLNVILSQQILDPIGAPITPQTSYFNNVRVKQFFLAPEITCPTVICSTGTATMDVATEATN